MTASSKTASSKTASSKTASSYYSARTGCSPSFIKRLKPKYNFARGFQERKSFKPNHSFGFCTVCIDLCCSSSKLMLDAIATVGPGFKGPTYHNARGKLLQLTIANIHDHIDSFKAHWAQTGCTLMADGWTDTCNRTLINFLVYCPRGLIFLKSVDASEESKTAEMLFNLFKEVVISIGVDNVIQIVTDNAANYVAAGRLLMLEFPKLYWTPCSAHCVDLMLEDFAKYVVEVQRVVGDAKSLTKFVYNHVFVLTLMRKFSKGIELVRPGVTRFATNFLTLQSLQRNKLALQSMVTSEEWNKNKISKTKNGKYLYYLVLNSEFWSSCAKVVNITEPLVRVLRMVDSDERPSMGYIFEGMKRVRETIRAVTKGKKEDYELYVKIIDCRWESQLQ